VVVISAKFTIIFAALLIDSRPWTCLVATFMLASAVNTRWIGVYHRAMRPRLHPSPMVGALDATNPRGG